jgi:hypothetical protein
MIKTHGLTHIALAVRDAERDPYLFASDPDGCVVEILYEMPTPVDP